MTEYPPVRGRGCGLGLGAGSHGFGKHLAHELVEPVERHPATTPPATVISSYDMNVTSNS